MSLHGIRDLANDLGFKLSDFVNLRSKLFGNRKYLTLSGLALTDLPPSILAIDNIIRLDLSQNQFELFPEVLLRSTISNLNLQENQLRGLPQNIDQMSRLEFLDVGFNQIEILPKSLWKLPKLRHLNLSFNYLTDLNLLQTNNPPHKLRSINVSYNRISTFPREVLTFPSLKELNLSHNLLREQNLSIVSDSLVLLNLSNNHIRSFPDLRDLPALQYLFLNGNKFKSFELDKLPDQEGLRISLSITNPKMVNLEIMSELLRYRMVNINLNGIEDEKRFVNKQRALIRVAGVDKQLNYSQNEHRIRIE